MSYINNKERNKKKEVSLLGIFGKDTLKELLNTMTAATDFSFSVIDYRGNPLIESSIQNDYCRKYENQVNICGKCQVSAAFAAAKAAINCEPYIYTCPQGFISIAVPVIVNEQYMGAIVGGRVRCEEEISSDLESSISSESTRGKEEEILFYSVPKLTKRKLLAIADLVFFLVQEMGKKETLELRQEKQDRTQIHLRDLRKKNEALSLSLAEQENQLLRAKVLPHFLLDLFVAVSNFAILENARKTEEFMTDISSILRYYVDEAPDDISIETELLQMENYLKVLKKQYGERMDYHMSFKDSCRKYKIPFLGLFPFLNYIVNVGFLPGNSRGIIFLDVEELGNRLFISMRIDDEEVSVYKRTLMDQIEHIPDQELLQEQVQNAIRRIKNIYGNNCKIRVQPDFVTIDIPKNHQDDENTKFDEAMEEG